MYVCVCVRTRVVAIGLFSCLLQHLKRLREMHVTLWKCANEDNEVHLNTIYDQKRKFSQEASGLRTIFMASCLTIMATTPSS